jgi:5-(carboxyamino)imidazole ribonucleotide synthase
MSTIGPGATIGILGSGQLGRMLAIAAAQLGYRSHVYAPERGPACDVAAFTQAAWDDVEAIDAFARAVDVVTFEFENVDPHLVARLAGKVRTHPAAISLDMARYRPNEKAFIARHGGQTARWWPVRSIDAVHVAFAELNGPAILKTNLFGYDGKGQARITTAADIASAWAALATDDAILEAIVDFSHEFSIILVRGTDGAVCLYDPPHNRHVDGILAESTVPAPPAVLAQCAAAAALARSVAAALDHVGVLTFEFFATAAGPVFNEMAPRVHNSGHWTIEGATTSQFENHIRAICGLPLGATTLVTGAARLQNLIGEDGADWPSLLAEPGAHVHLYGKGDPRPGRKMGHVTRLG